ncbi:MAG: MBOAT family protein [Clostridia bacterium]|nr:MBOAT family protein [Clostridia bacterium]
MVFSSIGFIYLFLAAVLLAHYLLPKKFRNAVLLVFSLTFYYVGEQNLVVLMILSTLTDYFCSLGIDRFRDKKRLTKLFLIISLVVNLSLLGYFKYADLFISSFGHLTGIEVKLLQVALPIGISFYTFQTMSYTIDVYRGRFPAERNIIDFAAFVTLFPQLVAGPIVRYSDISNELKSRKITLEKFTTGVCRFCIGLGKKVIIANTLASAVKVYDTSSSHTVVLAWLCALSLPLQIYFDFSGYSDMAIGLGAMLGFSFPENFNYPFISKSATEFWRRWHITLGTWFRDCVYFPMGGNRCSIKRHIFNLLVVWLLTGIWHGAAYNYIIWGLYYGVIIIAEKYVYGKWLEKSRIISRIYFAAVTVFGFVIFHSENLALIPKMLGEMVGAGGVALMDTVSSFAVSNYIFTVILSILLSTPVISVIEKKLTRFAVMENTVVIFRYIICLVLFVISTGYLVDGSYNPFMYFRF